MKISLSPRAACAGILSLGVMLAVGCEGTDLPQAPGAPAADGALRGEIVKYIADYDGRMETLYKLRLASGELQKLSFDEDPGITAGSRVAVWGVSEGTTLRVVAHQTEAPPVEEQTSALIDGTKKPVRSWAFVLVNIGKGSNLTPEAAKKKLFDETTPDSIRSYYREVSYGLQDLDGQVFGPLDYTPTTTCDSDDVPKALLAQVPGTFSQYLWYFGSRQPGCDWSGLAALGTADRPAKHSWYNASSGCVVLVQEPGHNFGMVHSSSIACTKGGVPVTLALPDDTTAKCGHSEYGNRFDPMGSGCFHMDGFQKAYQDWLTGCNVVTVTSSGTFTLLPIEKACNGAQLLQIPLATARPMKIGTISASIASYFIEYRYPLGTFDVKLTHPRVFFTIGGNIREAKRTSGRNWLLDMNPQTPSFSDADLPVGKEYDDPAADGPKFTVLSADADKAVIKIELAGVASDAPGKGTCDDMTAFEAPGPLTCNAAPATPDGGAGGTGTGGGNGGGGNGGGGRPDAAAPREAGAAVDARPTGDAGTAPSGIDNPGTGPAPSDAAASTPPRRDGGSSTGSAGGGTSATGGCSCSVERGSAPIAPATAALFALAFWRLRRRRR